MKKYYGEIKEINQTDFQKEKISKLNVRFNRWHDKQINLLTFLINLVFTLSSIALGLIINNYDKNIFQKTICSTVPIGKIVAVFLFFSIVLGLIALFFRFFDFKYTKDKIKYRKLKFKVQKNLKFEAEKDYTAKTCQKQIDKFDIFIKYLGKLTLIFFALQSLMYLFALFALIILL